MFCGLVIMSSKFVVCISLNNTFSFMLDDFDIVNLALRQICLCCIILNTKMEMKDVLKTNNKFYPIALNFLYEFVVII
jgi:hypothetical protein